MSEHEEYSVADVFRELESEEIQPRDAEALICGIAWRSLPNFSLAALEGQYPALVGIYATRLLEAEVANGGLAQAAYNLQKAWFERASEGYRAFGEAKLAEQVLEVAEHLPPPSKTAPAADGDLAHFAEALGESRLSASFPKLEDRLVHCSEAGLPARSDHLLQRRDEWTRLLGAHRGTRMKKDERQRIEERLERYLRSRKGPSTPS